MITFPFETYWASALGVAVAFYGFMVWLGKSHCSAEAKAALSLWLTGEYESNWAHHFNILFDRVFGEKHLSWKCFMRSSIASILAVVLIYILFSKVLGVLHRAPEGLTLWQALLFGASINIVPDFISLLETRWILKHIDRFQSVFSQISLLVADAIFTGLIIWFAINAFQWFTGGLLLTMVEMLAMFSIYSVFFYSTFLTSVWAWLYCISTWFIWLFSRTVLKNALPIESKPEAQIGLVGGLVIFAVALGAKPIFESNESFQPSRFDAMLCEAFPADVCWHVARLTANDQIALEYLMKACNGGGPLETCSDAAFGYFDGDVQKAVSLFDRACNGGLALGCGNLGAMYEEGRGVNQDYAKAFSLFTRACDAGLASGCRNLGLLHKFGRGVDQDYAKAFSLYKKACDSDYVPACSDLGILYQDGSGADQDVAKALSSFEKSCAGGDTIIACHNLARIYKLGIGVNQDYAKAASLYTRACEDGSADSCSNLGNMYETGEGVNQDWARALTLYEQACEKGYIPGCLNLGNVYFIGPDEYKDVAKARSSYERACENGDIWGCYNLANTYRYGLVDLDNVKAASLYSQSCDGGLAPGCVNLGYLYELGEGVDQDKAKALSLFERACDDGDAKGCSSLEVLCENGFDPACTKKSN